MGIVDLEPGATSTVTVSVHRRDLAYWDDRLDRWVVEGGKYRLYAAKSSRELELECEVQISGDALVADFTPDSTVAELMSHPSAALIATAAFEGLMPSADAGAELGMDVMKMVASMPLNRLIAGGPEATLQIDALLLAVNSAVAAQEVEVA